MKAKFEHGLRALALLLAMTGGVHAAIRTWDGGGLDGSFSNAANWDLPLTVPTSNSDTLQVGGNTVSALPVIGFDTTSEFRTPSFTFLAGATTAYTVTAASVSDFLTLTGTSVALSNASPVRQKFDLIVTAVGAATQTWDGGAQGLLLAQIDLGASHVLTIDGSGTGTSNRNEIKGGITGTATSGITKTGAGTLLLDSNVSNDYSGATTIANGRLQLGRANQIPDASKLVLNGGTFDTGGFSDTLGTLLLGGSATIDFGVSNLVSLLFGDSHLELWTAGTLNILNFSVGADSLRFGANSSALSAQQLAQIKFNGVSASIDSLGFLQPVPEPSVSLMIVCGLTVLGSQRRRGSRSIPV